MYITIKDYESQGQVPGQASDYTLWAPNPLDSRTHNQTFYQDFEPVRPPGILPPCPLPALMTIYGNQALMGYFFAPTSINKLTTILQCLLKSSNNTTRYMIMCKVCVCSLLIGSHQRSHIPLCLGWYLPVAFGQMR